MVVNLFEFMLFISNFSKLEFVNFFELKANWLKQWICIFIFSILRIKVRWSIILKGLLVPTKFEMQDSGCFDLFAKNIAINQFSFINTTLLLFEQPLRGTYPIEKCEKFGHKNLIRIAPYCLFLRRNDNYSTI